MDVQRAIVERFPPPSRARNAPSGRRSTAALTRRPVGDLRAVRLRPGHPEASPRNKAFAALARVKCSADEHATRSIRRSTPAPDEVVVTKRRVSAFAGSDLDVVLRASTIGDLVLCGISTSGVVLSTLRQAADLDFDLTVLRDACADADDEVHRVLTEKVFPRQADVLDVAAWTAALAAPVSA